MHLTIGQNLFGKIQCILIRGVRDAFIAALAVLTRCCLETLAALCDGPWKTLSTTVQSHKKIVKITKSLYYFSHSFYLIKKNWYLLDDEIYFSSTISIVWTQWTSLHKMSSKLNMD